MTSFDEGHTSAHGAPITPARSSRRLSSVTNETPKRITLSTPRQPGGYIFDTTTTPTYLTPTLEHNQGAMSASSSDASPPPSTKSAPPKGSTVLDLEATLPPASVTEVKPEAGPAAMLGDTDELLDRIRRLEKGLTLVLDENMDLEKRVKKLEKKQ